MEGLLAQAAGDVARLSGAAGAWHSEQRATRLQVRSTAMCVSSRALLFISISSIRRSLCAKGKKYQYNILGLSPASFRSGVLLAYELRLVLCTPV